MAIRITSGIYRGRILKTDTRSGVIRPTSDKVRQALYNSLASRVPGASVVDLYAGSGAVGLEALSRGAGEVHLVDNHGQSWSVLKANCESLDMGRDADGSLEIHREDAMDYCARMAKGARRFDLVFADPPFDRDFTPLREAMLSILGRDGLAVVQFPHRTPPSWIGPADAVKRYGESGLVFFGLRDETAGHPDRAQA